MEPKTLGEHFDRDSNYESVLSAGLAVDEEVAQDIACFKELDEMEDVKSYLIANLDVERFNRSALEDQAKLYNDSERLKEIVEAVKTLKAELALDPLVEVE
jgi:hypothetical protein